MKKILLIHGPNLNKLGIRNVEQYGDLSLAQIQGLFVERAKANGLEVEVFQSNHEGALIDFIQGKASQAVGIVINPGALTHYSYALHDALVDTGLPSVEVHLSDIQAREEWRKVSVVEPACVGQISGKKEEGYLEAIDVLLKHIL